MGNSINRRLLLSAALTAPFLANCARATGAAADDRPLFVMMEYDPWLEVYGADSPAFALYADGLTIFMTESGYRSVKLTRSELAELKARLNLGRLSAPFRRYKTTDSTDQVTTAFYTWAGDIPATASIYGPTAGAPGRRLPQDLLQRRRIAKSFNHPRSKPWRPEKIEVMLWPWDEAPGPAKPWPADWPDTHAPSAKKRREGWSLFIPSDQQDRLQTLVTNPSSGAVAINGRKWVAHTRLPFPQERRWMGLLRQLNTLA